MKRFLTVFTAVLALMLLLLPAAGCGTAPDATDGDASGSGTAVSDPATGVVPDLSDPATDRASDLTDPAAENSGMPLLGGRRERQMTVAVDWSGDRKRRGDVTIKVYVDGELDPSKTETLDESVTHRNLTFSGSGIKTIKVKINDDLIYTYVVDFDRGTVEGGAVS